MIQSHKCTTCHAMCYPTLDASKNVKFRLSLNMTKFDGVTRFRETNSTVKSVSSSEFSCSLVRLPVRMVLIRFNSQPVFFLLNRIGLLADDGQTDRSGPIFKTLINIHRNIFRIRKYLNHMRNVRFYTFYIVSIHLSCTINVIIFYTITNSYFPLLKINNICMFSLFL